MGRHCCARSAGAPAGNPVDHSGGAYSQDVLGRKPTWGRRPLEHTIPSHETTMSDLCLVLLTPHPTARQSPPRSIRPKPSEPYLDWHFSDFKVPTKVLGSKLECRVPESLHVYRAPRGDQGCWSVEKYLKASRRVKRVCSGVPAA